MSKKRSYLIPVFIHVDADSFDEAEFAAIKVVDRAMQETTCTMPDKRIQNWSLIPFNVRKK